ncbi:hypothetical protein BT69DRAFT_1279629 [Atractiella rhizophila]|nr:hypothetical protein BT69DRAFT_1290894 [Atractiella rhizophila]KAH8921723.1 hypothetical protein BT69DRAFT_1282942 [Atractiella rhizophila]KAH8925489.1 hypothetical protein BT69DRAFT_1279629 [Atractiella rhizophila]
MLKCNDHTIWEFGWWPQTLIRQLLYPGLRFAHSAGLRLTFWCPPIAFKPGELKSGAGVSSY